MKKKHILLIFLCASTMLLLSSCAALSDDTYYRIGYDVGTYLSSENINTEGATIEDQPNISVPETISLN